MLLEILINHPNNSTISTDLVLNNILIENFHSNFFRKVLQPIYTQKHPTAFAQGAQSSSTKLATIILLHAAVLCNPFFIYKSVNSLKYFLSNPKLLSKKNRCKFTERFRQSPYTEYKTMVSAPA